MLPIKLEEVVLGQYEGYKDDSTVSDSSNTPTFATVILRIDNERWEGHNFHLLDLSMCSNIPVHSFDAHLSLLLYLGL